MAFRLRNVAVDCNDLEAMTSFWAALLGYEVWHTKEDYALLGPPDGGFPRFYLQRVPERRGEKNRLHLDLDVGTGDLEEGVREAEAAGAHRVESHVDDGYGWWVMADPEGNLFCIARMPE